MGCRIRRVFHFLLLTLIVLVACLSPLEAKRIEDKDITLAVETELLNEPGVPSNFIDVQANKGVVILTGTVTTLPARDLAIMTVQTVKGVRAVVNRIKVIPPSRQDEQIRKDVKGALARDPATDSYEVDVEVKEGRVTLTGMVDSWQERHLSEEVAKGVRGVKEVKNFIALKYKIKRPDSEIKAEIERVLEWDVWVDDALIKVEVEKRHVTLTGVVGSAAEKSQALQDALVAGVKSVDTNKLEVKWWLRDNLRREQNYTEKSDEEIEEAVKDAFLYDPRVLSFNPNVEVDYGVAILTGVVSNLKAKKAAEEDARNTVGVWRVKNYLKVRPDKLSSDTEIKEMVQDALLKDPGVERHEISVSVVNAKVYLYGWVDSLYESDRAEDVTSRVKGVVEVQNNLKIQYPRWDTQTAKSDWEIKEDIKSELWWSPYVDSEQVTVTVRDGVATLTGTVDSWQERLAAQDNSYEGGARRVNNYLAVKDGHPAYLP
jgi:osmotically-inducible protein OsmY